MVAALDAATSCGLVGAKKPRPAKNLRTISRKFVKIFKNFENFTKLTVHSSQVSANLTKLHRFAETCELCTVFLQFSAENCVKNCTYWPASSQLRAPWKYLAWLARSYDLSHAIQQLAAAT